MMRGIALLIVSSAAYGFAIGSVHSSTYAVHNLIKFPLLLTVTALVCAPAYFISARFFTSRLPLASCTTRLASRSLISAIGWPFRVI